MPMLKRLAPLVPLSLALLLTACASSGPQHISTLPQATTTTSTAALQDSRSVFEEGVLIYDAPLEEEDEATFRLDEQPYELPALSAVLERGHKLIGTPYRAGGSSLNGFDCSGFVNFLFREEAGIRLPRSTREMIKIEAPRVARHDLQPGDLIFFGDRGRVNHAGIYVGDGEFIHSSSKRSGGVRIDKLASRYWNSRYLLAKRVLEGDSQ
ncbi:C40 family peptidase [Pseudomonas sp. NW5]|uniref:C40 family peptidase n=1 Tax=Pseudomonas sp. NW5 TaxID=2934934 RepID=UPI0020226272|nr:C40 family peptidase [Pseudomonas sp. NW5]